jgi:hypothetical protein
MIYTIPGTTDTWGGKPGRLYTPAPRTVEEIGEAVLKILAGNPRAVLTITAATETKLTP